MKIFRMDEISGRNITNYDSNFIMRKLLMTKEPSHVGIVHLEEGGIIGYHDAAVPQILLIIDGEGWVRTGNEDKVRVTTGDAVVWEIGEGHETTTTKGMKAIVVESQGLDIHSFVER
ncbi:cupin [Sporosarcina sp. NPDC096371]|uniref:cupin n=1 Tax=Sporosarcina sp. NPDC096371 TaxID=3364530 RepID=UPI0038306DE8